MMLDLKKKHLSPCCNVPCHVQIVTDFREGRAYELLTCDNCYAGVREVYTGEHDEDLIQAQKKIERFYKHEYIERVESV